MLPGLRFLFAAIVLSMSVLVFGLGAAALLRAAHEEFVSVPSRRAPPETVFAQPNEAARPVLATLRVDPPVAEPEAPDNKASENIPAAAETAEPIAIVATPAEPERIAALKPDDSSPPATEKPEITITETPPPGEAAPVAADASAPTDEIKIAATAKVSPPSSEAAPAASEQASAPASPESDLASMKIATLGGPLVTIEPPAQTADAEGNVIKKRAQARRAKERRRLAQRARLARQAPQQPAAAFPQPTITTRTR
jgi:hypothetical protein